MKRHWPSCKSNLPQHVSSVKAHAVLLLLLLPAAAAVDNFRCSTHGPFKDCT
jgi:hypothetical protein